MADFRRLGEIPLEQVLAAPGPTLVTSFPDGKPTPVVSKPAVTFEDFNLALNPGMKDALALCQAVAAGKKRCALLAGVPGTGKTMLAKAAMSAWVGPTWFRTVPDFLSELREAQFGDGVRPEAIVRELQTDKVPGVYAESTNGPLEIRAPYQMNRLVVFDDLGTEKHTEWAGEQLYRVLDSRYDRGLPTIITTNVGEKDLDPRILSRYAEGLVVCKGKDVRRAAR